MAYKLTPEERETTINYSEADKEALVTTCNAPLIRRLRKAHAEELSCNNDFGVELVQFSVPIKWLKISPPRQNNMTDEQRAARAEKLKLSRSKRVAETA